VGSGRFKFYPPPLIAPPEPIPFGDFMYPPRNNQAWVDRPIMSRGSGQVWGAHQTPGITFRSARPTTAITWCR
jgi:hypothetical protein